jgi:hypothetical protein
MSSADSRPGAPYDVTTAAGLPETVLPESLVARLPAHVAPAPWLTRDCRVVSWLHEIDPTALEAIPEAVRPAFESTQGASIVAWALVRYGDTPVGPYSEIAATLLAADPDGYGHIPFIVVDSETSVVGGRANWLLPKALADFDWSADGLTVTVTAKEPACPAWTITVEVAVSGDPMPLSIPSRVQQASTAGWVGRFEGEMSGALRSATVTVNGFADGPLAGLLRAGQHGATILTEATFDVGPLVPS